MGEAWDSLTAQKIKEFWINPSSQSYSHHNLCKEYADILSDRVVALTKERDEFKNLNEHHKQMFLKSNLECDELKKLALELLKELMYLDGYSPDRHGNSIDQNAKLIQRAEKILDEK